MTVPAEYLMSNTCLMLLVLDTRAQIDKAATSSYSPVGRINLPTNVREHLNHWKLNYWLSIYLCFFWQLTESPEASLLQIADVILGVNPDGPVTIAFLRLTVGAPGLFKQIFCNAHSWSNLDVISSYETNFKMCRSVGEQKIGDLV